MSFPGISETSTRAGPPPPPPPPPVLGQVPALRISTELGGAKRSPPQEAYEPPAAIQNAMMTKDKKPFTYTPGMGGKLDLSQIRSPRMARRVAKNANDEGVEGPPKSALAQEPKTPTGNIYSHPQVAVPVFPQQAVGNNLRSTLPRSPTVIERVEPAPKPLAKIETKIVPVVNSPDVPSTPTSPTSPTQITLAKAPTPWMQKQVKQQEELPEWAKRPSTRPQDLEPQPRVVQIERVPPPRIEDRPSVFSAMNEPGHHQLSNTTPHHQSRWGNPVGMSCPPPQQQGAAYIIPVQMSPQQQYQTASNKFTPVDNQNYKNTSRACIDQNQQEPGPVQSKSFRVLQKITDTDPDQFDSEQVRKLQLTEDDRCLMNKFKEQVDGDTYLHQEEDPRYRGAAIPSRAFRYLQNITESGESPSTNTSRPVNSVVRNQNRNSKTFEEPPVYLPPSEQQAPEPKKYMGGAIPSRSFRILQAMTAPESIGAATTASTEPPAVKIPSESGSLEDKSESSSSSSEEDDSSQTCDSSSDSDSYLAYSTGLNPLKNQLFREEHETNDDSTDCGQQDIDEDDGDDYVDDLNDGDNNTDQEQVQGLVEEGQKEEEEDEDGNSSNEEDESEEDKTTDGVSLDQKKTSQLKEEVEAQVKEDEEEEETTISVRLPLKLNNKQDKVMIETCVDFTLKRPQENPKFVVTSMENVNDEIETEPRKEESEIPSITTSLLSVPHDNSLREEVTDDEDSGVTSDISRMISEVDTDSESCLGKPRLQNKKYQRTQTHSRLFRLLSLEQLKLPKHQDNSSNSSGVTSPECSLMQELGPQLPTRPKSLDCEALFQRYHQKQQDDSYYQTWKNGQQEQSQWKSEQWQSMNPRFKVLCPRVKSARNLSQTRKSQYGASKSAVNTVSSNVIPSALRHC